MKIAEECGCDLKRIRLRLEEYFDTAEGQDALARAPKCMVYTNAPAEDSDGLPGQKMKGHATTKDVAIELLLQELQRG